VSVWAARGGCERAVTFRKSGDLTTPERVYSADDGTEIASILGLEVTQYERMDVRHASPGPAELFANPFFTTDVATQVMEGEVQGTLWMSGRHGEQFWHLDPRVSWPWYEDPLSMSMAGSSTTDMRLRIGYFNFPVPYTLGVHARALNRIGRSEEMAPWRIGGSYDRPIPRRLLETAGVPRDLFGQVKMGGNGNARGMRTLTPMDETSFRAFYHERVPVRIRARLVADQRGTTPFYAMGKMGGHERWLRTRRCLAAVAPRLLGNRRHHRWGSSYLYAFHWGFETTSERYRVGDRNGEFAAVSLPQTQGAST
jgi:hypothetical protein